MYVTHHHWIHDFRQKMISRFLTRRNSTGTGWIFSVMKSLSSNHKLFRWISWSPLRILKVLKKEKDLTNRKRKIPQILEIFQTLAHKVQKMQTPSTLTNPPIKNLKNLYQNTNWKIRITKSHSTNPARSQNKFSLTNTPKYLTCPQTSFSTATCAEERTQKRPL